jgi:hypothetical protein
VLVEKKDVRQIPGEGERRWFTDDYFDLIVWYEEAQVIGFQLCYDKGGRERALTWHRPHRYLHTRVDNGEIPMAYKMSPVLVQDGAFDHERVAEKFRRASAGIEPRLAALVLESLRVYPAI